MNVGRASSGAWRIASLTLLVLAVLRTVTDPAGPIDGDARIYVEAAQSIGDGRYEAVSGPSDLPRYPPGYPLMIAPFVALGDDDGARVASTGIGALLVILVWACARRLAGHRAAAVAAVLWMLSPLVSEYSTDVMSDPAGAAFVMGAFLAGMHGRWVMAGVALAWSGWIRLIHAVFLLGLGRRRWAWLAAGAVLLPLAVFQLRTYGRLAGYDGGEAEFSLSNIFGGTPLVYFDRPSPWPNWQFFPGLLWGLEGGLVPLLPLFAAYELVARRAEPAARLAAWIVLSNVAVYLPYFYQTARFVLPAACLVIVFAAAGGMRVVDQVLAARPQPAGAAEEAPSRTEWLTAPVRGRR